MVRHMENLLAITNVYMCNLKRIYVTLCVCLKEREREREGFIALFFYARDGMNLSVRVCVCVRVSE